MPASNLPAGAAEAAPAAHRGPRGSDAILGRLRRIPPRGWLAAFVLVDFAIMLYLANLRVLELQVSTWDLGIYQQALWSTGAGHPFYEAPDWETGTFGTLLQVHSTFLLYIVVPFYRLWPSPVLLLAIQAGVVALAALPLYGLTRDVTGSRTRALLAAGVLLVWAPIVSSGLYDFHIEAFLPVELLTLAYLWQRRQYGLGFAAAAVSFATMEFAPVLVLSLAAFFLADQLPRVHATPPSPPGSYAARWVRAALRDRAVMASVALAVVATIAYYAILAVRVDWAPAIGLPPFPSKSYGYVIGGTPSSLGLSLQNLGVGSYPKLTFWIIVYGLVGFVPWLVPRHAIAALPLFVFTFFSGQLNYVSIGFQYGFAIAAPVLVGFAYGLDRIRPERFPFAFERLSLVPVESLSTPRPRRRGPPRWTVAVGAFVLLNLAISPINPLLQQTGPGSSYRISYTVAPGYSEVVRVSQLIPAGSFVLADSSLFPLVANNLHAYSMFYSAGNPALILPFNASHPPTWVFLSKQKVATTPSWLVPLLYDPTQFGLRAVAWTTPLGPVFLWEIGYSGPALELGIPSPTPATFAAGALAPGPISYVGNDRASPTGTVIVNFHGLDGNLFNGPEASLPSGSYVVTMWVRAYGFSSSVPPPGQTVFEYNADAFAHHVFVNAAENFSSINSTTFVPVTFNVTFAEPVVNVEVRGYVADLRVKVAIAYLEIAPVVS